MKTLITIALIVMTAGMAQALPVGSVTIGDKIFGDFSVTGIDPSMVYVMPIGDGSPNDLYGIQIQAPFVAIGYGSTSISDFGFQYTVRTVSGDALITDIHQAFNLTLQGTGGIIGIGETVFDQGFGVGNLIAQSSVGYLPGEGGADLVDPEGEVIQGDQLNISPPANKVWVTKDIYLMANQGGLAGATTLYQRFSQRVPDGGSTLILLGAVFSSIAYLRMRRF